MKRNWRVTARIYTKDQNIKEVEFYFETKADAESFMKKYSRICGNQIRNLNLMNLRTKKDCDYIYVFDL